MKKILVVDDEPDSLQLFRTILESEGYGVITAGSGKECLEKLKDAKVDLLLLDFFMPGMSGRQVCEELGRQGKTKSMKIAMFTVAQMSAAGIEELKKLGVVDYIQKPIEREEMVKRVKKLVK